jgi:hypothetical protein
VVIGAARRVPAPITFALALRGHSGVVIIFALPRWVPDPEDAPAHGAQGAGDAAVAGAVGGKLFRQKAALVFGGVAWSGQPGQKQPSAKTARRCGRKTKSGFTRKAFNFRPSPFHWSEAPRRQPVMPWTRKSARRRSSLAALPRERRAEIPVECFRLVKISATTPVRFWQLPKGVNLRGGSPL